MKTLIFNIQKYIFQKLFSWKTIWNSFLHSLTADLHSLSKLHTSIQWQKSRITWLKEADANSKIFHGVMSSRRRVNYIVSLSVNGNQIEGVSDKLGGELGKYLG